MCITSFKAETNSTIIYSAELESNKNSPRHILAYKNAIQTLEGGVDANAMHLPIPTSEILTPSNILDWYKDPEVLANIYQDLSSKSNNRSVGKSMNFVVDTTDYVIGIINDITHIDETLSDSRFLGYVAPSWVKDFYIKTYPAKHFKFIWAVFKNKDMKDCSPLVVEYVPSHPEYLYFPTIDAHGEVPKLFEDTELDQRLIFGSYRHSPDMYSPFGFDISSEGWSTAAKSSVYSQYFPDVLRYVDLGVKRQPNLDMFVSIGSLIDSTERNNSSNLIMPNLIVE